MTRTLDVKVLSITLILNSKLGQVQQQKIGYCVETCYFYVSNC